MGVDTATFPFRRFNLRAVCELTDPRHADLPLVNIYSGHIATWGRGKRGNGQNGNRRRQSKHWLPSEVTTELLCCTAGPAAESAAAECSSCGYLMNWIFQPNDLALLFDNKLQNNTRSAETPN